MQVLAPNTQLSLLDYINSLPTITAVEPTTAIALASPAEPQEPTLPYKYPVPLRPYQVDGARFLRESHRAMCTYQPGLGKTETAIAACIGLAEPLHYKREYTVLADDDGDFVDHTEYTPIYEPQVQDDPSDPLTTRRAKVVIVCPSFLTDEWFDRILKYLPYARVVMVSGTRKAREKALKKNADWYIINYEMLHARPSKKQLDGHSQKRILDEYNIPDADFYIFDESHKLKNHNGKQAQAAAELAYNNHTTRQPHVFLLSGTPIKREPDDLYMQMHILYPHIESHPQYPDMYFRSYNDFVRNYCIYLPSPWGNRIVGAKGQSKPTSTPIQQLMDRVAHYISYEDADIYRPEVQTEVIHVQLSPEHQKAYDDICTFYAYKNEKFYSAIEVLHALRAVTSTEPNKIKAAVNLTDQFSNVMYFTHYVGSAKTLARHVTKESGIHTPFIAGSQETSKLERARILHSQPTHLVGTMGSLSVGINNLIYMKAVGFFEEDWTPDMIEQSLDRVRRFGNDTAKVFQYIYLCRGTVDEHIHAVVGRRGVTAEMIVRRTLAKFRKDHGR